LHDVPEYTEAEPEVTEAEFACEHLENLRVLGLGLSVLCVEGLELAQSASKFAHRKTTFSRKQAMDFQSANRWAERSRYLFLCYLCDLLFNLLLCVNRSARRQRRMKRRARAKNAQGRFNRKDPRAAPPQPATGGQAECPNLVSRVERGRMETKVSA